MGARPYMLPRVFGEVPARLTDMYCRAAIRAAWAATRGSETKSGVRAAREDISRWRLPPATIDAMARALFDYNQSWPNEADGAKPAGYWLTVGSGCTERSGTLRDAHLAAWDALYAALSILVEIPIEHPEDEAALLLTLAHTGWRVPHSKRKRVAKRFARYVSRQIEGEPFVPAA